MRIPSRRSSFICGVLSFLLIRFRQLANYHFIGMVDHFNQHIVRYGTVEIYRVEIWLLYRRAVIAPSHRAGVNGAVKLTGHSVAVQRDLRFPRSMNGCAKIRPFSCDGAFTFITGNLGPNGHSRYAPGFVRQYVSISINVMGLTSPSYLFVYYITGIRQQYVLFENLFHLGICIPVFRASDGKVMDD